MSDKPKPERVSHLTSQCGAHCGVDGFSTTTRIGHCTKCHQGICEASKYDRSKVKPT